MKTYEMFLHSITKGRENDRVTFDIEGKILSWEIWSDFLQAWVSVPIEIIDKTRPSSFRLAEKFIEDRAECYRKPFVEKVG